MQLHLALGRQRRVIILDEQHKVHLSLSQADACRALLAHAKLLTACETVFVALTGPEKFNRQGCIEMLRAALAKANPKE